MIVIDTSALMAVLLDEPEAEEIAETIARAERCLMSAANYIELGTVIAGRQKVDASKIVGEVDGLLAAAKIELAPVTDALAREALIARIRFGKGFGAPAGLNFGGLFRLCAGQGEPGTAALRRR